MNRKPDQPHSEDRLRRLSSMLDGELPKDEAQGLARDLAGDAALRHEYEELQALDDLLGRWPAAPVADVRGVVMARVRADLDRAAKHPLRAWRWAGLAWAATWVMGGMLTGLTLWTGVNRHIDAQIAAENMAQDMTISMIMTEDWTPPITFDEDAQP